MSESGRREAFSPEELEEWRNSREDAQLSAEGIKAKYRARY